VTVGPLKGEKVYFFGNAMLDSMLADQIDNEVWIYYEGKKDIGDGKTLHQYEVQAREVG
jgi:hypothetical protein